MKKLSEFKDGSAIVVVAKIIPHILKILTCEKNRNLEERNPYEMFSGFLENSPEEMIAIFAILSEKDVNDYHCDGVEALSNLVKLVSDDKLLELFTSAEQKGDATSSASASANIEE